LVIASLSENLSVIKKNDDFKDGQYAPKIKFTAWNIPTE
jgi:hypothetical protein